VVVDTTVPLQIVEAQAMREHQQLARACGDGRGQRLAPQRQRLAVATKAERNRQRIAGLGQVVAQHAIQCGDDRFTRGGRLDVSEERSEAPQNGVDAPAHEPGHAVYGAVDQSRDAMHAA
jgi:hypothetical protein